MGLFRLDGTRATKSGIAQTTDTVTYVTITEDLYRRRPYGPYDENPAGDELMLYCRAGKRITQAEYDKLFPAAVVDSITPASGSIAGGDVVTITGKYLDGVTAVTFGGNPGANVTVVSAEEVQVTTPAAGAAGAVDVVATDDSGDTTVVGGFTYQ